MSKTSWEIEFDNLFKDNLYDNASFMPENQEEKVKDFIRQTREQAKQEEIEEIKKIVLKNKHCGKKGCQICLGVEETVSWILSDIEELKKKGIK